MNRSVTPGSFKKGHAPSKPKGTKHKKTLEWEAIGNYLISDGAERAKQIMRKSDDKDFMNYFNLLLEYFKPKLARAELTGKDGEKLIDNNQLPNINLSISDELLKKIKG